MKKSNAGTSSLLPGIGEQRRNYNILFDVFYFYTFEDENTTDAPEDGFTYTTSAAGVNDTVIQNALKNLKINVAMKNGDAPEFANDTNWTLTSAYNGVGTYKATKELTIPDGYEVAAGVKTTLEAPVTVKDVALESIAVTKEPNKRGYKAGETFDPTGMVVTATYDDKTTKDVTDVVKITSGTVSPEDGQDSSTQQITISYTEGENTKTTTQEITVYNEKTAKDAMLAARMAYYTFDDTLQKVRKISHSICGYSRKPFLQPGARLCAAQAINPGINSL